MLPKKQRIKLKKDFDFVFRSGKSLRNVFFILKFVSNNLSFCRGAVIVQAKFVPKAVTRNKIKRTIFEVLSEIFPVCKNKVDVVIIVQPNIKNQKLSEARESLFEILKKANIA